MSEETPNPFRAPWRAEKSTDAENPHYLILNCDDRLIGECCDDPDILWIILGAPDHTPRRSSFRCVASVMRSPIFAAARQCGKTAMITEALKQEFANGSSIAVLGGTGEVARSLDPEGKFIRHYPIPEPVKPESEKPVRGFSVKPIYFGDGSSPETKPDFYEASSPDGVLIGIKDGVPMLPTPADHVRKIHPKPEQSAPAMMTCPGCSAFDEFGANQFPGEGHPGCAQCGGSGEVPA